jgi:hypothetical protein
MSLIEAWTTLAADIRDTSLEIFATANVAITAEGFADEKFLALTLLARTVSNTKGAMVLLDANRIVEARVITRCCLENFYWTIGLAEEGKTFVDKMRDDEMSHRKAQGQTIFAKNIQLEEDVRIRLRAYMKENKRFDGARTLSPKQVAEIRSDFEKTYIFYSQLSSDAAHPSVTALNRYSVAGSEFVSPGFDVEPVVKDEEVTETLEYLCMAAIGVGIGVNQILGGTTGGNVLNSVAERYIVLSNRTKMQP